jgi:riboflavin kinase/FMN adenylyltransferase
MARVSRLLGRFFSLEGPVVPGDHRGALLGFPTANIAVDDRQALPPDGVYATWAYPGGRKKQSMTNIGVRPTFGDSNARTIEVFIMDYDVDMYGKTLRIELVERLRGEIKFATAGQLQKQIAEDVERGLEILGAAGKK